MAQKMLILFIFTVSLFAEEKMSIAVNELTGSGVSSQELSIISGRLRSELFKTGKFTVMDRGEMKAILQEQEFQISGACDESSCMVDVGEILGVTGMVAGNIGKMGNFYTISIRLINVGTSEIEKTADFDFEGSLSTLVSTGLESISREFVGLSPKTVSLEVKKDTLSISIKQPKKKSSFGLPLRIIGSIIGVGGAVGGYMVDQNIQKLDEDYHSIEGLDSESQEKIKTIRKQIESGKGVRSLAYIIGGVGFSVTLISFAF